MQYGYNIMGELQYILTGAHGYEFGVFEKPGKLGHECKIEKYDPNACMVTDASMYIGLPIPETLPAFDSFIRAARFLKENIDRLT